MNVDDDRQPQLFIRRLEQDALAVIDAIDAHPLLGALVRGEISPEGYRAFLRATYHYVRWSGPLLAETAAGVRRSGRTPWLVELLDRKTREESPHDRWVLDDLAVCGENVELVKAAAPPRAVSAYVEWSRSLAQAGSPGYLGAAFVLEFVSARRAKAAAESLRARGKIPHLTQALSFLDGHGDADVGHVASLLEVISRVEDPQDRAEIGLSAEVMRRLYPLFFERDGFAATAAAA
jgi:pyrroloquinoline quinone (PQQ) biosynthesis protein C